MKNSTVCFRRWIRGRPFCNFRYQISKRSLIKRSDGTGVYRTVYGSTPSITLRSVVSRASVLKGF